MRNKPRQLGLRLTSQCPVALTAQTERELIEGTSSPCPKDLSHRACYLALQPDL